MDPASGLCTACNSYWVASEGICFPCLTLNCISCSPTDMSQCMECASGFFKLSATSCYPCSPECESCSSFFGCTTYKPNIIVYNNQFYTTVCHTPCTQCLASNPEVCLSCPNGFFSTAEGKCMACDPSSNCATCNATQPSECLSCESRVNLGIVNGVNVCLKCQDPCETCQNGSTTVCESCSVGYSLVNGTCMRRNCSASLGRCLFCEEGGTNCLVCEPGYFRYRTGACVPGMPACWVSFAFAP